MFGLTAEKLVALGLSLFVFTPMFAGQIKSEPLGHTLDRSLKMSSLTMPGSKPFHIKIAMDDPEGDSNTYKASIEEYWVSPTQWKRIVTAPGISQVVVANETGVHFQNSGDYFPLWLQNMVGAFDNPVPLASEWDKSSAKPESQNLPGGQKTLPCLNGRRRIGTAGVQADVDSSICFLDSGQLRETVDGGYAIGFHDYRLFGSKWVSYLLIETIKPGTEVFGAVTFLEDLKHPDSNLFVTPNGSTGENSFLSIQVSQDAIQRMAGGSIPIVWPPVREGETTGICAFQVSVDREGKVRESYPLHCDNHALEQSVHDQLVKMSWKPAIFHGNLVQVESPLAFKMTLQPSAEAGGTAASDPKTVASPSFVSVSKDIMKSNRIAWANPIYPVKAREAHLQGTVLLYALIGKDGLIKNLRMLDSPDPILTKAAMDAVKTWKYRPYLLNGQPVEVRTTVESNFLLGTPSTVVLGPRY